MVPGSWFHRRGPGDEKVTEVSHPRFASFVRGTAEARWFELPALCCVVWPPQQISSCWPPAGRSSTAASRSTTPGSPRTRSAPTTGTTRGRPSASPTTVSGNAFPPLSLSQLFDDLLLHLGRLVDAFIQSDFWERVRLSKEQYIAVVHKNKNRAGFKHS